ncbi:DinB family protein [Paenibacillus kobensis]|uniref:DinB family protein n=1 Tax=Paenibacillus kobensis TaxID=59841 RepID=UPI000FDC3DF5|nr:DinB family protein [Paenibacillus kobensis]
MSQLAIDVRTYLRTHEQLQQAIEGLTDEGLRWKAAPNSWSVTEVLAHLTDHNLIVSFRIREILARSEVRLPAFNQDAWVAGQKANEEHAADILAAFKSLLEYNSLLFQRLEPEDWEKTGTNAKGETVTLSAVVRGFIAHLEHHLLQIARIRSLESGGAR